MAFLQKSSMTNSLLPEAFFHLEQFAHRNLFDGCVFVWEALERLSAYIKAQKLGKIEVDIPSSVHLINPETISIGSGTVIEPGAYIQGPCIIGNNCQIRHGAYIRGDVIAGEACVIGHNTEIKHSILLDRASAAHFNYVGDSILGNGVNLGAGVKCANLRLDHSPISIVFEGKTYKTGLKKLGAIIGDGSQLGCNSVTNPGLLMGRQSLAYPCINVHGYIPERGRAKGAIKQ
jgi:NDP-sugar pyrophosphorylase family protein